MPQIENQLAEDCPECGNPTVRLTYGYNLTVWCRVCQDWKTDYEKIRRMK